MKLLMCFHCSDVFKLQYDERVCECGRSWGRYLNERDAEYGGSGIGLGFDVGSIADAIRNIDDNKDWGEEFKAFVVPMCSSTFKQIKKEGIYMEDKELCKLLKESDEVKKRLDKEVNKTPEEIEEEKCKFIEEWQRKRE